MASYTPNIPLHCSICPKRPMFSDVSHLLTHIASKGHLSHYYKVQIRSASEDDAREQVDAYNTWYTEWGIEHLMSDRMNLKDKRRTRTRSANARRQGENAPPDLLRRQAVSANTLDPRLADQLIKNEPTPSPSPQFMGRPYPLPLGQQQSAWPSPYTTTSGSLSNPGLIDDSDVFTEKSEISHAMTPPTTVSTVANKDAYEAADATTVSEASKLKGIYWPGMDIFDSATPEMKRKRNQKKDVSVVEQLELNSREVEATEHIWTTCGTFHKERPISGSVTDSSPVKLDPSPARDFHDRPPLMELIPNVRHSSRLPARGQRRNINKSPKKPNDNDLILADEEEQRTALQHDRLEQEHSLGPSRKRKRTFEVYREEEEREPFGRPTSMSTLTAEFTPRQSQQQSHMAFNLTPQPIGQPQQQLGQLQQQLGQPFSMQDFPQGIGLPHMGQPMHSFQPAFDPLGFGFNYHMPAPYLENNMSYQPHPFQPFHAQSDMNGILGTPFTSNNPWIDSHSNTLLNSGTFEVEGADMKAQVDEDDERTITAPTTPTN